MRRIRCRPMDGVVGSPYKQASVTGSGAPMRLREVEKMITLICSVAGGFCRIASS